MTCLGCVSTLSGFGTEVVDIEDPAANISEEAVGGLKKSLGLMFGVPVAGSAIGATGGALVWKSHRVWGGVIGFFLGGAAGGALGAYLAKSALEKDFLPEVEQLAEQMQQEVEVEVEEEVQKGLPTGNIKQTLKTPEQVVAAAVNASLRTEPTSVVGKAVQKAVTTVQGNSAAAQNRLSARMDAFSPSHDPRFISDAVEAMTTTASVPTTSTRPRMPSFISDAVETVTAPAPAPTTTTRLRMPRYIPDVAPTMTATASVPTTTTQVQLPRITSDAVRTITTTASVPTTTTRTRMPRFIAR